MRTLTTILGTGASLLAMTAAAQADPVSIGSLVISALLAVPGGSALLVAGSAALYGTIATAAIAVGATALSVLTRKQPRRIDPGELKQTIRAEDTPQYRGVGRVRVQGVLAYGNTKHPRIYRLILHLKGEADYVETYYLNGREVIVGTSGKVLSPPWGTPPTGTVGGGNIFDNATAVYYVELFEKDGADTDMAWSQLTTDFPTLWTAQHTIPGIAQTLMRINSPGIAAAPETYQQLFSAGPEIELQKTFRGEKIYDPRKDSTNGGSGSHRADDDSTWEWSDNGILCLVHIHRTTYGFASTRYDWSLIADEADRADVDVDIPGGGTEKRSRCWGTWAEEGAREGVIRQVLDSVGAEQRKTADGKIYFLLIDDTRTAEIEYDATDVYQVTWQAGPEAADRPNLVRVKYHSPEREYKLAEIPLHEWDSGSGGYNGPSWARYDDEIDAYGEKPMDLELPFCPSAYQAQRIARRMFAMERADRGEIVTDMSGWAAWGLRVASIEWPEMDESGICEIGAPRGNEEPGRVSIPFRVIPTLTEINPATDYADPPAAVPDIPTDTDLDTPAAPSAVIQVQYPDGTYEIRMTITGVAGADGYLGVYRTYTTYDTKPDRWVAMSNLQGQTYCFAEVDLENEPADFRVQAFNSSSGEVSNFSDALNIDDTPGVQFDNSAPTAPTIDNVVAVQDWIGTTIAYKADFSCDSISAVRLMASAGLNTVDDTSYLPGTIITVQTPNSTLPVTFQATAYASDGTPSPIAQIVYNG